MYYWIYSISFLSDVYKWGKDVTYISWNLSLCLLYTNKVISTIKTFIFKNIYFFIIIHLYWDFGQKLKTFWLLAVLHSLINIIHDYCIFLLDQQKIGNKRNINMPLVCPYNTKTLNFGLNESVMTLWRSYLPLSYHVAPALTYCLNFGNRTRYLYFWGIITFPVCFNL